MDCPVCDRGELSAFFEVTGVPVFCNVLHETRAAAVDAPRGDVRLGFCAACGMIFNTAFDPARVEYAPGYENSLHVSPRFQAFATELARRLVDEHDLRDADLLEIGGGRGEFLELLCAAGGNRGVVYDPSAPEESGASPGRPVRPVRIVRQALAPDLPDVRADLVCSRHVLEHLPDPRGFVATIARFLARHDGCRLYLEVPSGLWTLRDMGIWDIIYEHCSYFTPWTLRELLAAEGLADVEVREAFGGQFLSAETPARASARREATLDPPSATARLVREFSARFAERVQFWSAKLDESGLRGQRLAVWGVGSKGVTFLNTVAQAGAVVSAIDVSPRKQGRFLPGTGQRVMPPADAIEQAVDEVVVMNPIYLDEVRSTLDELGYRGRVSPV